MELFNFLSGITTLFVIVAVLNNYKGVANVITALGNLYGQAVRPAFTDKLPFPNN